MEGRIEHAVLRYDSEKEKAWIVDFCPPMMIGQERDVRPKYHPWDVIDDAPQYPYMQHDELGKTYK